VPGGVSKAITAGQAAHPLASITPAGSVAMARCKLAAEFIEDVRRIDIQMRDTKKKLATAVRAAGTSLTGCSGPGRSSPRRSSAMSATPPASPAAITSPLTTALRRSRCPPAAGRSTGCPGAATAAGWRLAADRPGSGTSCRTRSYQFVTCATSCPVAHVSPKLRKFVRPYGSQRGSQ